MPINIYKRFYIVFNQEDKGCSIEGKEVTGYLKVEFRGSRGRITAALQNLNPMYSYNVKLLKGEGEVTVVDFGAIKVDDKGRGGGEWTFNVEDVKDSGISWEEFSVAFIEAYDGIKTLIPLASVINKKLQTGRLLIKNIYQRQKKKKHQQRRVIRMIEKLIKKKLKLRYSKTMKVRKMKLKKMQLHKIFWKINLKLLHLKKLLMH